MATSSPDQASPSAAHQVLNTPELLERIILDVNVDMKTLLLSQRVNRFFKAVIDGSTHLQQALFFRQAPLYEAHLYDRDGWNPLLDCPPKLKLDNLTRHVLYKSFTWEFNTALEPIAIEPSASWRRMLLTHRQMKTAWGRPIEFGVVVSMAKEETVPLDDFRVPSLRPIPMGEYEKMALAMYRGLAE